MKKIMWHVFSGALIVVIVAGATGYVLAATQVPLATATQFAVLAGSTITNTGASVVQGNLGLSPGTSVTGFPPGVLNGVEHINTAVAVQAKADSASAYSAAAGQAASTVATELGGTTKNAGVYKAASGTFGITGTLTLDAQGDTNAVFIFQTDSTLITASASKVVLMNGAQACNVFWKVGSSATLGANTDFKGNILAATSITLTTGASVEGGVFAQNGAVTLDTNTVTKAVCVIAPPPVVVVPPPVIITPPPAVIPPVQATTTPAVIVTPQAQATSTPAVVVPPVIVVVAPDGATTVTTPQVLPVVNVPVPNTTQGQVFVLPTTPVPVVPSLVQVPAFPNTGVAPRSAVDYSTTLASIIAMGFLAMCYAGYRRTRIVE